MMQMLSKEHFKQIMERFLQENKDRLGLTDEDLDSIRDTVVEEFHKANPGGIPVTEARNEPFMKAVELVVVSAIAMKRDLSLELDLSLMFKNSKDLSDLELRNLFRELLTRVNMLKPEPKRASKEKIEAAVEELMQRNDKVEVADELKEFVLRNTLEAVALEKILFAEASLTGGVTRKGQFIEMAVKMLPANDEGIPLIGPVFRAMGVLSDTGIPDAGNSPEQNAIIEANELGSGILKSLEGAITSVVLSPHLGLTH